MGFRVEGGDDVFASELRAIVEAPQYLDTSELFVDVHPQWLQCIIKGKSIVLHLPVEVKASECRVRRVRCNGWLELILPKVEYQKRPKRVRTKKSTVQQKPDMDADDEKVVAEANEL